MKPYFLTHPVGVLYFVVLLGWYFMELVQLSRQQQWREDATEVGSRSFWLAFAAAVATTLTVLVVAPHAVPGAAIGHPAATFAAGLVLLVAGAALRVWSFHALGKYFTFTVKVSPDQPVITRGPYRVLRHPGYAGGLLAIVGIGLVNGNWISLATIVLLFLGITIWRIRIEEHALLTSLDGRYGAYAAHHKRLVPLVW